MTSGEHGAIIRRTSPEDAYAIAAVEREQGALVIEIHGRKMIDKPSMWQELSRATGTGIRDVNVYAEFLEDLQAKAYDRVVIIWNDSQVLERHLPDYFRVLLELTEETARDLKEATAWGAPPSNFPDHELLPVTLRLVLADSLHHRPDPPDRFNKRQP